ncbi:MAG: squalene/phytoene synthase family protein [Phycisphaerales bacterium]|nr:squalene/phytoene synthase family protein [Phycisphaerales bacterium]
MMATIDLPVDAAALRYCEDVTRREARNFYYGLRLLPEPQRSALYCIYAWMRRADDLADDDSNRAGAADELEQFRQKTNEAFLGSVEHEQSQPMWRAFAATIHRFNLEPAPFDDMIRGQQDDLDFAQPRTMDDLIDYCRKVASSVGRVCIQIWGYDDPHALQLADERGIAFQLTNILRDVREDHLNGRIYLPSEMLNQAGMDVGQLLEWTDDSACESLIRSVIDSAEAHYASSSPLEGMITPGCRPTLQAMTRIYHGLLQMMDRNPRLIAGPNRVRLGKLKKLSIALMARMQAKIS